MRFALVLLMLAVTGCAKKIQVISDTCWDGNINGGSVEGCGNSTYELKENCFTFQKKTDYGSLRINFKKGSGDEPSTTAAYGVVSGCADD